jgi:predicted RNA binding protein with dsRBD fold (UPF0201 family)
LDEVTLRVETPVNFTESEEKVRIAVENIFGKLPIAVAPGHRGSFLTVEVKDRDSLTRFRNLLRNERIRDAARRVFFQGMKGNTIDFCLNKQVAFVGHVSFSGETSESPLDPIRVTIISENPKELVDWLAPRTA